MKNVKFSVLCLFFIFSCAEKKKKTVPTELIQTVSASNEMKDSNLNAPEQLTIESNIIAIEEPISISYNEISEDVKLLLEDAPVESIMDTGIDDINGNLIYNIEPYCNRINGKSFRCCGRVLITRDGQVSATITTRTNRYEGFTGAIRVVFKDENKVPLFEIQSDSYGINAKRSRTDQWNYRLESWKSDLINISSYASVYGIHTPSNRTGELFAMRSLQALEAYAKANGVFVNLQ